MLSLNPSAKTLILVPTISLAGQQCTAYEKAGFGAVAGDATHPHIHPPTNQHLGRHRVDWFCSDRQVGLLPWELLFTLYWLHVQSKTTPY